MVPNTCGRAIACCQRLAEPEVLVQGLPGFSKGWKWHSERRKLKLPSSGWLEASGSHVAPSKAQWAAAFPAHTVDYAALNSPPGDTH